MASLGEMGLTFRNVFLHGGVMEEERSGGMRTGQQTGEDETAGGGTALSPHSVYPCTLKY